MDAFATAAGWIAALTGGASAVAFLRTGRRDRAIVAIVLLALAIAVGHPLDVGLLGLHLTIGG